MYRLLVAMVTFSLMVSLCTGYFGVKVQLGVDGCSPRNSIMIASLWRRTFKALEINSQILVAFEMHRRLRLVSDDADKLLFPDHEIRLKARNIKTAKEILHDQQLTLAYLDTLLLHNLAINSLFSKPVLAELMLHVARSRRTWIHATREMFEDLGKVIARFIV